jgi:hypothetical protein
MQPDADQTTTSSPTRRLTAQEASATLGITVEAIRGRIKRGTLRSTKDEDGTVFVYLDAYDQTQPDYDRLEPDADQSHSVADQSELVRVLNEQLQSEREANRENRRIIALLASRVPELEAAQEPRESPQATADEQGNGAVHPEDSDAEKPSWWRRFFGFE